jgi:hypothetical protein
MNIREQLTKLTQEADAALAEKLKANAAHEQQHADLRNYLDRLVLDFNTTPMQLKRSLDGTYPRAGISVNTEFVPNSDLYARLGDGLRFYLIVQPNDHRLYQHDVLVAMNAVCAFPDEYTELMIANGAPYDGSQDSKHATSHDLMSLEETQACCAMTLSEVVRRPLLSITSDWGFGRPIGSTSLTNTGFDHMFAQRVLSSPLILPYLVL